MHKLSREDWDAFQEALNNPPEPNDKLRSLLRATFDDTLFERIPDDLRQLVERLK